MVIKKLSSMETHQLVWLACSLTFIAGLCVGLILAMSGVLAVSNEVKPVENPIKVNRPIMGLTEPSDIQPAGGIFLMQKTRNPQE